MKFRILILMGFVAFYGMGRSLSAKTLTDLFNDLIGKTEDKDSEIVPVKKNEEGVSFVRSGKENGSQKAYAYVFNKKSLEEDEDEFRRVAEKTFSVPAGHRLVTQRQENIEIRYGDYIRLWHRQSGSYLHSHHIRYYHKNSSGHQQITCFKRPDRFTMDELSSWWQVWGATGTSREALKGKPVDLSKPVTLFARSPEIDKWFFVRDVSALHSHDINKFGHPSPVREKDVESEQGILKQEVTAFADGDENDEWEVLQVKKDGTKKNFKLRSSISLRHKPSLQFLRSASGIMFNVQGDIDGNDNQQEVSCVVEQNHPYTTWTVGLIAREANQVIDKSEPK